MVISNARSSVGFSRTSRWYDARSERSRVAVLGSNHTRVLAAVASDSRTLSTSASAPQWPASWRAIVNQKFRTSSGRGKSFAKPTYSAIVFFSSSMAISSTSRMVARRGPGRAAGIAAPLANPLPRCKKRA